jgi:hypothetical protein
MEAIEMPTALDKNGKLIPIKKDNHRGSLPTLAWTASGKRIEANFSKRKPKKRLKLYYPGAEIDLWTDL